MRLFSEKIAVPAHIMEGASRPAAQAVTPQPQKEKARMRVPIPGVPGREPQAIPLVARIIPPPQKAETVADIAREIQAKRNAAQGTDRTG